MTWTSLPIPAELCPCGGMRAAWRAATGQPAWTLWHASQASGLTHSAAITEAELRARGLTLEDALADHVFAAHLRGGMVGKAAREEEDMSTSGTPPAVLRGNCFVITGVLDGYTRDAAHAALRLIGASHADEVGSGVDCLVVGTLPARYAQRGTSKERAARSMGIPIMDGDTFVQRLNRERQVRRRAQQDESAARARATRPVPPPPVARQVDVLSDQALGTPIVFAPPEDDDAPPAPPSPAAPPGVVPDAAQPPSFADLLDDLTRAGLNRPRKARP